MAKKSRKKKEEKPFNFTALGDRRARQAERRAANVHAQRGAEAAAAQAHKVATVELARCWGEGCLMHGEDRAAELRLRRLERCRVVDDDAVDAASSAAALLAEANANARQLAVAATHATATAAALARAAASDCTAHTGRRPARHQRLEQGRRLAPRRLVEAAFEDRLMRPLVARDVRRLLVDVRAAMPPATALLLWIVSARRAAVKTGMAVGEAAIKREWAGLVAREAGRMRWCHREAPETLAAALKKTQDTGAGPAAGGLPTWPFLVGTVARLVAEGGSKERADEAREHNGNQQPFVADVCKAASSGGLLGCLLVALRHREADARFTTPVHFVEPLRGEAEHQQSAKHQRSTSTARATRH